MYICIYVYMYICKYVYMYICICVYVNTNVLTYVCLSVCLCVCLDVGVYVCLYVGVYVCMHASMCVCMCVCIFYNGTKFETEAHSRAPQETPVSRALPTVRRPVLRTQTLLHRPLRGCPRRRRHPSCRAPLSQFPKFWQHQDFWLRGDGRKLGGTAPHTRSCLL